MRAFLVNFAAAFAAGRVEGAGTEAVEPHAASCLSWLNLVHTNAVVNAVESLVEPRAVRPAAVIVRAPVGSAR